MADGEEEEGCCYPDPADLDEVDVEDVALFREVARCLGRLVGLQDWVVGRVARRRRQYAEEGAEEQSQWVYREENAF